MAFFARPPSRSAAIKIVPPPAVDVPQDNPIASALKPGAAAKKADSTQRQCRNIMIHGYCKYEGKGCMYYHPPKDDATQRSQSTPPTSKQDETNNNGAKFTAQAVNAPVFVPKSSSAIWEQKPLSPPPPQSSQVDAFDLFQYSDQNFDASGPTMEELTAQIDQFDLGEYALPDDLMLAQPEYSSTSALNPYYQPQNTFTRQPLNYHLYTLPVPVAASKKFFISDNIREELLKRAEAIHMGPAPGLHLPEEVQGYHSLVPMELPTQDKKKFNNWNCVMYKATKIEDGRTYALRRIENFRLMNHQAFTVIEKWRQIRHPSIVSVHEAFTARAFGDNSLVVVYDYHPNAQNITEVYFKPKPTFQAGRVQHERVNEATLWSYIFQIGSAIKAVHESGLALRMIDPSKVLVTGPNRVRVSSCALFDILLYDTRQDIFYLQQEDMILFGKLILSLCFNNPSTFNQVPKTLEAIGQRFSADVKNVIVFLVKPPGPMKNIVGLFDAFGHKLVAEMDAAQIAADRLEGELMGELENARLVRLLCKFGFINERPEFDRDPRWSETGDRYIIKLFRDYVFHSVDENGNPVVSLAHVLTNLNKLDAGSDERIMLVSRDEQSCLVVTYRQVKTCIESAFSDLSRGNH